jgi:hypothetical protein
MPGTNGLGSFDPNVLPMDAFLLTGTPADEERLISLRAPWKFDGESSNYPISGFVSGRGWWTKFADGTLIQSMTVNFGTINITTTFGSCYRSSSPVVSPDWPIEFYSLSSSIPSSVSTSSGHTFWLAQSSVAATITTPQELYPVRPASQAGITDLTIAIIGVGRWKA